MFRLLLIFAIISLSNGHLCQKKTPSWRIKNQPHWKYRNVDRSRNLPENDLSNIGQKLIDLEESLQSYCKNNGNHSVTEVYGSDNYILKYDIPEYEHSNITITIYARLLEVNAEKLDKDGKKEVFKDMRLLPDILNLEEAKWNFESKLLKIFIPYKILFVTNTDKDCGTLNRNIINVPVMADDASKKIVFRSADDSDKDNKVDAEIKLPQTVH